MDKQSIQMHHFQFSATICITKHHLKINSSILFFESNTMCHGHLFKIFIDLMENFCLDKIKMIKCNGIDILHIIG